MFSKLVFNAKSNPEIGRVNNPLERMKEKKTERLNWELFSGQNQN